jgi:iron(III) transport system substrate-binding protein
MQLPRRRFGVLVPLVVSFFALGACSGPEPDVVIYTAMDQVHSEEILRLFQERTGLTVRMEFDTEANKTVGMVSRLRQEAHDPRCDVFWNNEIANTIALAKEGLLEPYDSPAAADIPESYRDPEHHWTGFALRARCLILNTERLGELESDPSRWPSSILDLESSPWNDVGSVARPLTGTTLTHFAVLYDVWGDEEARRFVNDLVADNANGGVALTSGNGPLMRAVGEGALAWGFTDTDDFNVGRLRGYPVERRFPDQGEGEMGTLVIPNTVALMKNAPNPENGRLLIDFLLSEEVEELLAKADSAQIPTRADVPRPAHVPSIADLRVMVVDWERVGAELPRVQSDLKQAFLR